MKRWLSIALLLLVSLDASAWYDGAWLKRFPITSDATLVDEDLGVWRYPLSAAPAGFWTAVASDGADIRVTTSVDAPVPFEVVGFDSGASTGEVFFKAAGSTSVDVTWYIYYDNSAASALAITDTYGAENVWTSYAQVLHVPETGGTTALDSTTNDNDGTSNGTMTSGDNVDGPTSDWPALDFDNSDDWLSKLNGTGFDSNTFTISGWFYKPASDTGLIFGLGTDATFANRRMRFVDVNFGGPFRTQFYLTYSGGEASWRHNTSGEFPATGTWFHLALTMDASSTANDPVLYIDGTATTAMGETGAPSGSRSTGGDSTGLAAGNYGGDFWGGRIANFRYAPSVRSANFIATEYAMESDPGTFWTTGAEESVYASGETGWLYATAVSTTINGGDVNWTNSSNIIGSNTGTYASLTFNDQYSYMVLATTYDTSGIPSGATIDGVRVRVFRGESGSGTTKDLNIQLLIAGSPTGTNKAVTTSYPATASYAEYGGTADLWGLTPTYSQVTATNFGVGVQCYESAAANSTPRLYYIAINVTYTAASGPTGHAWFYRRH